MSRKGVKNPVLGDPEDEESLVPSQPLSADDRKPRLWFAVSGAILLLFAAIVMIILPAMSKGYLVTFSSNLPNLGAQSTQWMYHWFLFPAIAFVGLMRIVLGVRPCWREKVEDSKDSRFTFELLESIIYRPANMGGLFFLAGLTDAWMFTALACVTILDGFCFYLHERCSDTTSNTIYDWVGHIGMWLARLTLWTILLAFSWSNALAIGASYYHAFLLIYLIVNLSLDFILGICQGVRHYFASDSHDELGGWTAWMAKFSNFSRVYIFITTAMMATNVLVYTLLPYYV